MSLYDLCMVRWPDHPGRTASLQVQSAGARAGAFRSTANWYRTVDVQCWSLKPEALLEDRPLAHLKQSFGFQ
jgi:hypothetical protein